ncbi:DUF1638 domain-containing protein [Rhizobium calliandrae]|uniref:DUF1638 domain-containing protein n=1 Tax=Rhizobium calliandrae TaxID=1312182 RepID=A0ABT7KL09_9HYPH|nr:DUF1638 domain-containing protein [Rhizobium calliandrae]MDL2407914.1 DUF1638 domain-containing protein [Rhizobium calliandrae]
MDIDRQKAETNTSPNERVIAQKVHVIACGAIAREILAITRINNLDHIDLHCFPAIYHSYPQKIAPALEEAIADARSRGFKKIFVGYADCGTGGDIDKICEREEIDRLSGPHCYSFFSGNEAFAAREDDVTSFFLTDFLARQFLSFVVVPLGLDRHPELKEIYFGNYRKVVYLSQEEDPALQEKAKAAAAYLGLDYEYRFTGYGDLARELLAV